jgi:hypothetical protein
MNQTQSQIDAENDQLANEREAAECAQVDLATKGRKDRAAKLGTRLEGVDTAALWANIQAQREAEQNARTVTAMFKNLQQAIGL